MRYSLLAGILLVLFLLSISIGSVLIPLQQVVAVLFGGEVEKNAWEAIVLNFRLPKAITAVCAGAGLAFSGLQMQTLFKNPLAGPFVLGISSGASLGVAILVLAGSSLGLAFASSIGMVTAASLGAFLVLMLIILVSVKVKDGMSLLIVGIMFGAFTSAVVSVLQYFSSADKIQDFLFWTFGSTGNLSWSDIQLFVPIVMLGILIGAVQAKPLNALLLGEHYAESMGMPVRLVRFFLILSTSLMAGVVTAFCGPVAFLGLAVPHMSRILFKTSNHFVLVPVTLLLGAIVLLFCDIIAQVPGADFVLPINAVTSLFGAPVVIWLIVKRRNLSKSFA